MASPRFLSNHNPYLSVLKIPETEGFGNDSAFFGASDEESKNVSMLTSTTACEFAIDIHKVSKIFGLLCLRNVAALNGRVQHQFHNLLIKLLLIRLGLAYKIGVGYKK